MSKTIFFSLIASVIVLAGLTVLAISFLPTDLALSVAILSPIGMLAVLAIRLK